MSKLKVRLNTKGVGEMLRSSEMQALLQEKADAIYNRVGGDGYATDTKVMGTRVIASVSVVSDEAMRDNYQNNTLVKALK